MEEMSSDVGRALLRDILGNAPEAGQSLSAAASPASSYRRSPTAPPLAASDRSTWTKLWTR